MTLKNQLLEPNTPVDVVSTLSLTNGTTYYIQATGIGTVQVAIQTTEPTATELDSGNVLGPADWMQLDVTTEPVWVWSHEYGRVTIP